MSGIDKDGAVRCQHCGSVKVVLVKTAEIESKHGKQVEDTYECQACEKQFSRIS
jgi:DNA-directed RNA polymerase subunit RPC12/RpoP